MSRPFDFFDYRDAVFASGLSRPAIATAFALTKWASVEDGTFYPHQDTISTYCGIPIATLRRHLREMESVGLLVTKTTQMGTSRIWSKNEYRLIVPDLRPSVSAGKDERDTDLRSPVSGGKAKSAAPPLIGEQTSAHSWSDLRSPVNGPPLTSGRQEEPREEPREQTKEDSSSAVAKSATSDAGRLPKQPPLMQSVPTPVESLGYGQPRLFLEAKLGRGLYDGEESLAAAMHARGKSRGEILKSLQSVRIPA